MGRELSDAHQDDGFFVALAALAAGTKVTVDRPRGSTHPRFADVSYPVDYGFLENTMSADQEGIDVFVGTQGSGITAAAFIVDGEKREVECKIPIGCSAEEIDLVKEFLTNILRLPTHLVRVN